MIFNIGGNNYRLVVHMSHRRQIAFIKFIGTHRQYDRIDAATFGRAKWSRFSPFETKRIATLVDAYESALVQDVPPDPIEALKFRPDQLGLPLADLARTLGSRPRASEILSRKRRMTLPMIRRIYEEYGVPPEILIQDYPLEPTGP